MNEQLGYTLQSSPMSTSPVGYNNTNNFVMDNSFILAENKDFASKLNQMGLTYVLINFLGLFIYLISIFAVGAFQSLNPFLWAYIAMIIYCFIDGLVFLILWKVNGLEGPRGITNKCYSYYRGILIDEIIQSSLVLIAFIVLSIFLSFAYGLFIMGINLHLIVPKAILLCVCKVKVAYKTTDELVFN